MNSLDSILTAIRRVVDAAPGRAPSEPEGDAAAGPGAFGAVLNALDERRDLPARPAPAAEDTAEPGAIGDEMLPVAPEAPAARAGGLSETAVLRFAAALTAARTQPDAPAPATPDDDAAAILPASGAGTAPAVLQQLIAAPGPASEPAAPALPSDPRPSPLSGFGPAELPATPAFRAVVVAQETHFDPVRPPVLPGPDGAAVPVQPASAAMGEAPAATPPAARVPVAPASTPVPAKASPLDRVSAPLGAPAATAGLAGPAPAPASPTAAGRVAPQAVPGGPVPDGIPMDAAVPVAGAATMPSVASDDAAAPAGRPAAAIPAGAARADAKPGEAPGLGMAAQAPDPRDPDRGGPARGARAGRDTDPGRPGHLPPAAGGQPPVSAPVAVPEAAATQSAALNAAVPATRTAARATVPAAEPRMARPEPLRAEPAPGLAEQARPVGPVAPGPQPEAGRDSAQPDGAGRDRTAGQPASFGAALDAGAAPTTPDLPLGAPALPTAGTSRPSALPGATLPHLAQAIASQAAQPASAPAQGPLRILTLQLKPADLGSVQVVMRLRGEELEMNLKTSQAETAELLRKDAGMLSDLLRNAGYKPDIITIQAGNADAGRSGGSPFGQSAGGGFSAPGGGQAQGGATPDQPGRRQSEPGADQRTASRGDRHDDTASTSGSGRSGVYL
ncbi:flagellar hook-length control protein FliK [Methylobacterium sp. ID0610]|uniref:flagellar hook-length control protein FliK n=1 Tax=Methylobacterium carpenticola TaxID=3344827 RepID=UPI0036888EA4